MATPQAHINFSSNAATPFTNVIVNDFVVYTDTNTQNIHLGVNQSGTSAMTVSYSNTSNSVTVQGNLIVTGSTSSCNFAISNILASNATITSNITVPYITMSNLTSSNATISNIVSWVHYSSNLLASNATVTSNITVPYITMSNLTSSNATISNIVSWVHYSSNLLASNATITSNITVPYITTSNLVSSNVGIGTSSTSLQLQIENSNQVFTGYWGPTIGTTSKDRLFLSSAAGGGISMTVGTSSNNTVIFDGSSLRPWIPGSNDLGSSGCPWGNIYASNCLTFPSIDGGKRLAIWTSSNAYSGIGKTSACMELNLVTQSDYMKFGSFSNANSTGSDELMRLTGTGNLIMKGGTIGASSGATGSASGISIAVSSPCWVKLASIYNGSDTGQALKSSFRVIGQIGQSHNTYSIDVTITGNADSSGIAAHVIQDTVFNGSGLWGTNNIFDLVAVRDRTNGTTTLYAVCNTSAGLNSAITLNFQIFALDKNAVSTAQATFYTNKTYTVPFTSGVPGTITSSYDSALGSTLTQFLVSSVAKWIKVSDTNGNIGIGTSNPAFPLQIETTATLGGQVGTTGAVIGSSNTRLLLYTACNYLSFHCGTNSNQAVLLDGSNPAFRPWSNDCTDLGASAQRWNNIYGNNLDLSGQTIISLASTALESSPFESGTAHIGLFNGNNARLYIAVDSNASTGYAGYIQGIRVGVGKTPILLNPSGGYVGINMSTAPVYPLDVNGAVHAGSLVNTTISNCSCSNVDSFIGGVSWKLTDSGGLRYTGAGTQPFYTSNASIAVGYGGDGTNFGVGNLVVKSNVGIGTSNPLTTLSVNSTDNNAVARLGNMAIGPGFTGGYPYLGFNALYNYANGASSWSNIGPSNTYGVMQFNTSANSFEIDIFTQGNVGNVSKSLKFDSTGQLTVPGPISKNGGTFDIEHPLNSNKRLVHSFIEGPRCDLIYRGTATLSNGVATIDIDADCTFNSGCSMTTGTFDALCANPATFLQNESGFAPLKSSISTNSANQTTLSIVCQDTTSSDIVSWMVVAERKDEFIKSWDRTNSNGFLVTEYSKNQS